MAKTDQQSTGWYWWSQNKYGVSKENETESGATKKNERKTIRTIYWINGEFETDLKESKKSPH